MLRTLLVLCCAATVFGADDPWTKVRDLKSGTEIRVYRRGSVEPVLARMDEATDERLLIVVKNEQIAILRDQVDRIDYRPSQKTARTVKETKTTTSLPGADAPSPGPQSPPITTTSTTTGTSVTFTGSKPDFQTLYRRPPPAPKVLPKEPLPPAKK